MDHCEFDQTTGTDLIHLLSKRSDTTNSRSIKDEEYIKKLVVKLKDYVNKILEGLSSMEDQIIVDPVAKHGGENGNETKSVETQSQEPSSKEHKVNATETPTSPNNCHNVKPSETAAPSNGSIDNEYNDDSTDEDDPDQTAECMSCQKCCKCDIKNGELSTTAAAVTPPQPPTTTLTPTTSVPATKMQDPVLSNGDSLNITMKKIRKVNGHLKPKKRITNNYLRSFAKLIANSNKAKMEARSSGQDKADDIRVIDKRWSDWSNWSECSSTCGEGKKLRFRKCEGECEANYEINEQSCKSTASCPGFLSMMNKLLR